MKSNLFSNVPCEGVCSSALPLKKGLITFHFSKNMLSFSKCDSFSKGAFVFKKFERCFRFQLHMKI